jgi:MFS family permease
MSRVSVESAETAMAGELREPQGMAGVGARPFMPSNAYRYYVVWLLFAVYVCNFVDRQILSIVLEPIKAEFGLHDWQLGLLSGFAFAIFYATLGIPIARLADRRNRVAIISVSIVIWSAFTALSGFARNFWHLLAARIGVGIGEAGCSPPAYSIIGDYFEPGKRATALSIYAMGVYGGGALGFLFGGQVAHLYGWRMAFFAVGLPGLLVALLVKLTLREPPRGHSEPTLEPQREPPPFMQVLTQLWTKRSFRHLSVGAGLHAFVAYGVQTFYAAFFIRAHGLSLSEASVALALAVAIGGMSGTYLGGVMCDRCCEKSRDSRWYLWVPAIVMFVSVPLGQLVYSVESSRAALWLMIPYVAAIAAYIGPSIASTQLLVGLRERALAGAVLLLILNLIGLGLGPMFIGFLSDALNARFQAQGVGAEQALADGLRWAMRFSILVSLWAGIHYVIGARTLRADIAAGARSREVGK